MPFQIASIQEVDMADTAVGTATVVAMVMIWEVTAVVAMVRMVAGLAEWVAAVVWVVEVEWVCEVVVVVVWVV